MPDDDVAFLELQEKQYHYPPKPIPLDERSEAQRAVVIGFAGKLQDLQHNELFKTIYGALNVKRINPGKILSVDSKEMKLQHDCTILGGFSGSVVFDYQRNVALGMHTHKQLRAHNTAISASRLKLLLRSLKLPGKTIGTVKLIRPTDTPLTLSDVRLNPRCLPKKSLVLITSSLEVFQKFCQSRECLYRENGKGLQWHLFQLKDLLIFSSYLQDAPDAIKELQGTLSRVFSHYTPIFYIGNGYTKSKPVVASSLLGGKTSKPIKSLISELLQSSAISLDFMECVTEEEFRNNRDTLVASPLGYNILHPFVERPWLALFLPPNWQPVSKLLKRKLLSITTCWFKQHPPTSGKLEIISNRVDIQKFANTMQLAKYTLSPVNPQSSLKQIVLFAASTVIL